MTQIEFDTSPERIAAIAVFAGVFLLAFALSFAWSIIEDQRDWARAEKRIQEHKAKIAAEKDSNQ